MATSGSFITSKYNSKKWLEFAWERTGYSIADNTSTIKWTLTGRGSSGYHTSGNFKVVIDGSTVYESSTRINLYPGTVVASGTKTIKHNSDGSKSFSASAQAGIYYVAVNCSGSGSWTLNSIPRQANLTAAPNFNDEGNPTISFSNPAGNAVTSLDACISLTGSTDDIKYRAVSKTGSSYTFSLTTAERNVLRNACTTANSRTVKFYLRTVIGGNTYYSTMDKTLTIVNATPTLSPTVVDSSTMVNLTGDSNKLVKYYSDAKFTVGAAALKGASITSVKVTCGNKSSTATSGTLSDVESGTFVFTAKDSRGNSVSKTITKTLISYVRLTCNLSGNNPTTDGDLTFKINGNYFNGSVGNTANTLTVQYRYKQGSGSYGSWTTVTATKSGNTYTATVNMSGLNYKSTYTFQARATDKVAGTITTGEKTVRTTPVYDWGKNDFVFNVPVTFNAGFTQSTAVAAVVDDEDTGFTGDYVIEQGNDGSYAYRKWNSGLMEAWRVSKAQMTVKSDQTAATGAYYTTQTNFKTTNGAAQFTVLDHVQVSVNKNSSMGFWIPVIARTNVSGGVASADVFFVNPTKDSTAAISLYIYFIGSWK